MKVLNDLVGYNNLKIYQDNEWFCFSLESILLPNFVKLNLKDKHILDICSGNCPIPLVLSTKTNAKIDAIEIQKDVYELGLESIKYNKLEDKINLINDDILNYKQIYKTEYYDLITVNPPYFEINDEKVLNNDIHKLKARHEKTLDLDTLFKITRYLLKNNGRIALVHRTERLVEILETLKKYNLEPKRLQFIYPNYNKESKLFMIEATLNGNKGLKLESPLFIHNEDGTYRDDIKLLFNL